MNKLSKFIPVVNFCWIEFTLSKVWYKRLSFNFLNLCLEESGEFVTKELDTIQYCSPSRHFGWKTGNFMFQKCEFGQNVNLGKSNWQITGYPVSLRKIDAAALNCNLHPKRWSILKLKIWLDFAQSGGTSVGKRVQLCHWFEMLSPLAPNACDSLLWYLTKWRCKHLCAACINCHLTYLWIQIELVDWCHEKAQFQLIIVTWAEPTSMLNVSLSLEEKNLCAWAHACKCMCAFAYTCAQLVGRLQLWQGVLWQGGHAPPDLRWTLGELCRRCSTAAAAAGEINSGGCRRHPSHSLLSTCVWLRLQRGSWEWR